MYQKEWRTGIRQCEEAGERGGMDWVWVVLESAWRWTTLEDRAGEKKKKTMLGSIDLPNARLELITSGKICLAA